MRLTKIIALTAGIGLSGLTSCCNQDKIKEDTYKDIFIIETNNQHQRTPGKEEIEEFVKEFTKLVKKNKDKYRFNNEDIKDSPWEEYIKNLKESLPKYHGCFFSDKIKIREEALREYIGFTIQTAKLMEQLDKLPTNMYLQSNGGHKSPISNTLIYMFSTDYHEYVDKHGPISYNDFLKLQNNK